MSCGVLGGLKNLKVEEEEKREKDLLKQICKSAEEGEEKSNE